MLPYRENLDDRLEAFPLLVSVNYRRTAGQMAAEHWHPCQELLYVFDGEAEQIVGNNRFAFHAKDAVLIPAGMIHGTCAVEEECYIGVTAFNCGIALPGYYLAAGAGEEMERLFSRLQEESVLKKSGWQLIAQGILFEILGQLERYGEPLAVEELPGGEGQKLEEYLRQNLGGDLSLQSAAAYAGYSPAYFSRYFAKVMGMPFKTCVDRMKAQAARGMLADGLSAAATAAALGYDTPSSFCRAFKRLTGQTPSEYQSETQKMDRSG